MNEEEVAANFSFLTVEEAEGKDLGLIRKQRKIAESSMMDGISNKVFVWGLNDRHQLGNSQSDTKVVYMSMLIVNYFSIPTYTK